MKYRVKMAVTLATTVIEEVYEIEAMDIDEAEKKVVDGDGELVYDEIISYGATVDEKVTEIKSI
jgi:hypothetical protein